MSDIIQAHRHSSNHRDEIEASTTCGCFYCEEIYAPSKIDEWTDGGMTAICPICSIDSVIGDASGHPINKEFLSAMRKMWFW